MKPEPVATAQTKPAAVESSDASELPAEVLELFKAKKYRRGTRSRVAVDCGSERSLEVRAQRRARAPLCRERPGQARTSRSIARSKANFASPPITDWDPNLVIQCIRGYLGSKLASGLALGPQDEHLVDELALLDPRAMTGLIR